MKTAILLLALQLASGGADAYYTNRNLRTHGREFNPMVAQFTRNQGSTAAYFGVTVGLKIALPAIVRRKHPRLARALSIAGVTDSVIGAVFSATHP